MNSSDEDHFQAFFAQTELDLKKIFPGTNDTFSFRQLFFFNLKLNSSYDVFIAVTTTHAPNVPSTSKWTR
jgi:hypothetical protein